MKDWRRPQLKKRRFLKAYRQYGADEVRPRLAEVVKGAEFWVALAVGAGLAGIGGDSPLHRLQAGQVDSAIITYAAIAFGFCLAGLTIAITLPDAAFATELATPENGKPPSRTAFSDLLFVFSWTAVTHWLVIVLSLLALPLLRPDAPLIGAESSVYHRFIVGLTVAATIYALLQFLITVITLSQVGNVYVQHIQRHDPDD
ncbi:MAG TPA: hypothetical protein VFW71_11780 [Actinomycetota bacterium]|nr:hypothetical protein [Actinomycetota bacterium]